MWNRLLYLFFLLGFQLSGYGQVEGPEELYQKALNFKKDRKCNEAVAVLIKAIDLQPIFPDALYELGWCYNELKEYQKALSILEKARQQSPRNYKIIYELGFSKANQGRTDEALVDYKTVIEINPSFSQVYLARGDLLREIKEKPAEALKDYLKTLELDSASVKANYWCGWCYNDLDLYAKAIPYLQRASDLDRQNHLPLSELGFSFYSTARYDEALIYLKKADTLKPKFETVLYYMGLCYVKKGIKTEAVRKYNELVMLGSEFAITLLNEIKNMK